MTFSIYRNIVLDYLKRMPSLAHRELARLIATEQDCIADCERIYKLIRYYTGTSGVSNRKCLQDKTLAEAYAERTRINNIENNIRFSKGNVLCYSCLHIPAQHPRALEFLIELKKEYKPDLVVDLGDTFDVAQPSRHGGNPDIYSPSEELRISKEEIKPFIELFPKLLICESNHTNRYFRAAKDANIPIGAMRTINDIYNLPKDWKFAPEWIIDNVVYRHGFGSAPAFVNATRSGVSYVQGHLHSILDCKYASSPFSCFFGATSGCLVNPKAETMQYGFYSKARPVLGALIIHKGKNVTLKRMELGEE